MKIAEVISFLESIAHPSLQENYDNAGLNIGSKDRECTGIICTLDTTEEVIREAIIKKCNLVVSHHPVIFGGLKKISGNNYVEKVIISAIKNDIAVYAIHTNLDNVMNGVSGKMANMLGLKNISILSEKSNTLKKLFTFAPVNKAEEIRNALFKAGGGHIGKYSECSFNMEGIGTFKGNEDANPYVGEISKQHHEKEIKIEVVFPAYLESSITRTLKVAHPYEEVAFDIINLSNSHQGIGSGVIGELPEQKTEEEFLNLLMDIFKIKALRHTALFKKLVKKIALCGGAGSFLIPMALKAGADVFVTGDIKYHDFFEANGQIIIADIGHYESEQFTIDLIKEFLEQKFHTFAVLKTEETTNPVRYFGRQVG